MRRAISAWLTFAFSIASRRDSLAAKIEHTSRIRGDAEGFDILSFDVSGKERLIEVKTTKYGQETPFFVSRNELAVSGTRKELYHLYRLFLFKVSPKLFVPDGLAHRVLDGGSNVLDQAVRDVHVATLILHVRPQAVRLQTCGSGTLAK